MRSKLLVSVFGSVVLVSVGLIATGAPAGAATISVTTTADVVDGTDGATSLREAFAEASASAAADTIVLTAATTYELDDCAAGHLVDGGTNDLFLQGNGATIDQTCDDTRVIEKTQSGGTLTLDTVTLTGAGNSGVAVPGGAVLSAGHLVLDTVTVTGIANPTFGTVVEFAPNLAAFDIEVIDSTIVGNGGRAVDNTGAGGSVFVSGSTLSGNTGGGVDLVDGSPLVVESSTVTDNGGFGLKTTGMGNSAITVSDSTVSGNTNAGISCGACDAVSVTSSTVSGNGIGAGAGGGGGIVVTTDQDSVADAPVITVTDSIVTGNNAEHDGGGISVSWIEAHTATAATETIVSGSTVDGNTADCAGCDGGGIAVGVGSLTVTASHIGANATSGTGGGITQDRRDGDTIAALTSFSLEDSTVEGNTAGTDGGGVSAHAATLTIARTLVADNAAAGGAGLALGGIFASGFVQSGNATLDASTVAGNDATGDGGGVALRFPDGSNLTAVNSTIHGNAAPVGGGIAAGPFEPVTLRHATVTANSAATGANLAVSSPTSIGASVIAGAAGGGASCAPYPGFGTAFTSAGFSWFDSATCGAGATDVVSVGGDPLLGALAANGGPTPTRLPAPASPLGGVVPAASCTLTVDQRGEPRPAGVGCEPGAVEIAEVSPLIQGGPGPDLLIGTPGDDEIHGLGGPDLLVGLDGADVLLGGAGIDVLLGGPGADVLRGGPGIDVLVGTPGDTLDGGPGLDLCFLPGKVLPRDC
jgi:hypothetical protein